MRRATGGTSGLLELFTERQPFYRLADARRLVHVSEERLQHAIDEGVVEAVPDGTSLLIPWEDVASLALTRWTPRQIAHIVRRAGHPEALPPLNQFRTIQVELPVYQIRLLHYLAEQRSLRNAPPLGVSDVLEYELGALAAEEGLTALDRVIPGFAAAAHYPLPQDRPQRTAGRCVHCDVAMDGEACRACVARPAPVGEGTE